MTGEIIRVVLFIALLNMGSFWLNYQVKYHLKRMSIELTNEQLKEIKWLVSSVVTILTGVSYLAYLVLSH